MRLSIDKNDVEHFSRRVGWLFRRIRLGKGLSIVTDVVYSYIYEFPFTVSIRAFSGLPMIWRIFFGLHSISPVHIHFITLFSICFDLFQIPFFIYQ